MPLLAETLVEEWLNRQGFLTVRGVKSGVNEMDLLGVRKIDESVEGWHVEVQVSFRPVAYVSKLTKKLTKQLGKSPSSAWNRPPEILSECVQAWTKLKYFSDKKYAVREEVWPGLEWKPVFVHGVVRHPVELELIREHNITVIPLFQVVGEICDDLHGGFAGAAGADLADMIAYYESSKSEQQQ